MLSKTDIRKINQVRTILDRVESECSDRRTVKPEGWLEADAYDYGRVAQCANSAADLLFDLLNTMNAYRVQEIDDEDMHNRIDENDNEHARGFDSGYDAAIHDARVPGSRAYAELHGEEVGSSV